MNKLIAIVGMSGSGKTVATDYLESLGYNKIYFGGVILEKMKKDNIEITAQNEKDYREKLRKEHGMGVVAKLLLPKIKDSIQKQNTVLDGLYSWDEYLILKKEFKELKLICIITDKNIRYNRVGKRTYRPLNSTEIETRDYSEIENLSKGGPIAFADYFVLNNNGVDEYKKRLDEIINEIERCYDNEKND